MKLILFGAGALLVAGCASLPDTRAVSGFDANATNFTGWVRVTGGEFQLVSEQRLLRDPMMRHFISGALPQNSQDAARDLNGSRVEMVGRAVAWADRDGAQTLNHRGSLITNQCRSDFVIAAQTVRVLQ
jgi:hypothetical protein